MRSPRPTTKGLIHRDIKPANVVLCQRGGIADMAKVIDFGLVKDIQTGSPAASTGDVLTGTPLFMAPEAITHPDRVDGRTDLYALGAVGYFLLTGEYVFDGATLVEVCSHHLHATPTRLRTTARCRPTSSGSSSAASRSVPTIATRGPKRCAARCSPVAPPAAGATTTPSNGGANTARVGELRARGRRRSASPTELAIELARRAPLASPAAV
jgi:eukaryotic-like serine/threonine-protein kinase